MRRIVVLLMVLAYGWANGFCVEPTNTSVLSVSALKPFWGVRMGLHYGIPDNERNLVHKMAALDVSVGAEAGVVYHKPLSWRWFIEPGAYFYYRKMQLYDDLYNRYIDSGWLDQFGVTIPVNVGYSFPLKKKSFDIHSGPMLDVGIYGKEKVNFSGDDFDISRNAYHTFSRVNMLWNIGIAFYGRKFGVAIDYAPGLTNFYRAKDLKANNSIMRISVYYNFR